MLCARTRFLFMRPEAAAAELRQLLPLLSFTGRGAGVAMHSIASLIVSTAYSSTAAQSVTNHSRDCPVLSKKLPLSLIGKEPSFAARPCLNCVRERVHYVSSVSFCDYFEKKCAEGQQHGSRASSNGIFGADVLPKFLLETIERSYGSASAFKDSVMLHSTGAMIPGRLWIVYTPPIGGSEHGSLSLLNLPACKVPLVHGLWPLAVINITEKRLCEQIACRSGKGGDAVGTDSTPAWSHAARVLQTLGTPAATAEGNYRTESVAQMKLSAIQFAITEEALCAMNWHFVEMQLKSALAYYSSKERTQAQREHRKEKEHVAALRAMSQLKDSGAVIHATDSVTITSSNSFGASLAGEPNRASAAAVTSSLERTESNCLGEISAQTATVATSSAEATTANTASNSVWTDDNTATGPTASEPRTVQQADGTWEYHYNNGNVTKVLPDGTKVFQTENLTTTVFVNGDTLFEYPNNTSILDRADGVRVTTYADGTKREERLK